LNAELSRTGDEVDRQRHDDQQHRDQRLSAVRTGNMELKKRHNILEFLEDHTIRQLEQGAPAQSGKASLGAGDVATTAPTHTRAIAHTKRLSDETLSCNRNTKHSNAEARQGMRLQERWDTAIKVITENKQAAAQTTNTETERTRAVTPQQHGAHRVAALKT
jgi:hypothetical protein